MHTKETVFHYCTFRKFELLGTCGLGVIVKSTILSPSLNVVTLDTEGVAYELLLLGVIS